MTRETWYVTPRDPLAIGDGRGPVPFVTRKSHPLPLPGTVAGMVRASFLQGRTRVSSAEALDLLRVRVGAPWLVQMEDPIAGAAPTIVDHLLFAPADAVAEWGASETEALHRGDVLPFGRDEGVLWPSAFPSLSHYVRLPERGKSGGKLAAPKRRFWPLGALVRWSLGEDPASDDFLQSLVGNRLPNAPDNPEDDHPDRATREEQRIHVGIDDETQTAMPAILFSSMGQRMGSSFGIAVEVDLPPGITGGPGTRDMVVLGGESRLSFLVRRSGSGTGFPDFDGFRGHYERALEHLKRASEVSRNPVGIRLQLLSDAYLPPGTHGGSACLPSWHESGRHPALPQGLRLRLSALCMPTGPVAISGWNLRAPAANADQSGEQPSHSGGAPREIRRLVPAGSVYYFALEDKVGAPVPGERITDACASLWWSLLDPSGPGEEPDPMNHRAGAGADGYGRVLPGLWRAGGE